MIKSLITALREVCLEKPDEELADTLWFEPTAEELADAVWLATQIGLSTTRRLESTDTIANYSVSQQEDVSTPLLISATDDSEFLAESDIDETKLEEKTEHLHSIQLTPEESQPTEKTDLQLKFEQLQAEQYQSSHETEFQTFSDEPSKYLNSESGTKFQKLSGKKSKSPYKSDHAQKKYGGTKRYGQPQHIQPKYIEHPDLKPEKKHQRTHFQQKDSGHPDSLKPEEKSQRTGPKSGHLYTTTKTTETIQKKKSQQIRGRSFRTPAATMLPDALSIERALRPLMYRVESRKNIILDEEATVQRIAEEHVWLPVLQGEPERWFEVALVVDQSPSMVIWQQTIAELRELFERHGAFRNVRTWGIVTKEKTKKIGLFAGAGTTLNYFRPGYSHELIDPVGRRLFIVITDCISPAWHNGEMVKLLELWGQSNPIVMLQMLPRRLWSGSALREAIKVSLHASAAGLPNSQLKIDSSDFWFDDEIPKNGIKIPVLTLEPKPLAGWANMLMGKSYAWASGVVFKASDDYEAKPPLTPAETTELSTTQRLKRFYAAASPTAQKLATYLAAAPLTLPVMRLVQQVMLPKSRQTHLAEVFLSGLLRRISPPQESNPMSIQYDFHEGIRDLLLDSLLMSEAIRVLKKVSAFIEQRLGQSFDFQALLADPTAVDGIEINKDNRHFAEIGGKILRRLGGEYTSLAEQLEKGKIDKNKNKESWQKAKKIFHENDRLLDGSLGPETVIISAGKFRMGDTQGTGESDEKPVHEVSLNRFAMGCYQVTFAEYDKFAEATGRRKPKDNGWGRGNRPVIDISWYDAVAYTEWLTQQTRLYYRLPTEAEWEYAARAETETDYWWGNDIGSHQANCYDTSSQWHGQTAPVGSFAPNSFSLYNTVGNVFEWTCSAFEPEYTGNERKCVDDSSLIVRRGGSWKLHASMARATARSKVSPSYRDDTTGFRIVRILRKEINKAKLDSLINKSNQRYGFISKHPVGDIVKGTVIEVDAKSIAVQLADDVYGILNNSELVREDIPKTSSLWQKYLKKGSKIEVEIIGMAEDSNMIFLSVSSEAIAKEIAVVFNKFITEHPVGNLVKSTVIKISNEEINVQLADCVYGILRTSKLLEGIPQSIILAKILKKGDEIEVEITGMDEIVNLVFLSISPEEIKARVTNEVINILNFINEHPIGNIVKVVKGIISEVIDNIVVVQLADNVQGIFKKSELMYSSFKKDDKIEVKIIGIDEDTNMIFLSVSSNEIVKNIIIGEANLVNICCTLHRLNKRNTSKTAAILAQVDNAFFIPKIQEANLQGIGDALNNLNKINPSKTAAILARFDNAFFISKIQKANLQGIGYALNNLNKINPSKTAAIFAQIDNVFFISKIQEANLANIGHALIELNKVNSTKIAAILAQVDNALFIPKIQEASLTNIGNALNSLNKVNPSKTAAIFAQIDNAFFISKIQEANLANIGRALIELNKVNSTKTATIFAQIDNAFFIPKIQKANLQGIGKALNELNKVNPSKTAAIFAQVDNAFFISKIQEASLMNIEQNLNRLNAINPNKIASILAQIDYASKYEKLIKQA